MYQALYRAYRPEVFEEMLGQEHIIKILRHQLESGSVGHAYLLCGTRGTGKTTTARLLAKGVNCLSDGPRPCGECENCKAIGNGTFIDVIEIDAASNNSVENIRDLRESIKYPPAEGRKKVYIIDEVHMLSIGASNALLKTLEEPPEYVMFILATTEPQKLPATILSRCLRLDFRRVSENLLKQGMREICNDMDVEISDAALGIIALNADGSVRDCLSLLDQCMSSGSRSISRDDVLELLGTPSEEVFIELTHNVAVKNTAGCLVMLEKIISEGKEVRQLMKDWLTHYRALLISKYIESPEDMLNMSTENISRVKQQASTLDVDEISRCIMELSKTVNDARWSTQPRILLELAIVKMTEVYEERPVRQVVKTEPAPIVKPVEKKEEPEVKAVEEKKELSMDRDTFWRHLFEGATKAQPLLCMMNNSVTVLELTEASFTLSTKSESVFDLLKSNKNVLEEEAERITGLNLDMKVKGEEKEVKEGTSIYETAKQAEDRLGISIEVE